MVSACLSMNFLNEAPNKAHKLIVGKHITAAVIVTKDIPKNTIYAGNPAVFIRDINENEFITREDFFHNPAKLAKDFDLLDRYTLGQNSFLGWIKSMIFRDKSH